MRCLGEGVDVPSLDGIMFLHPRKSQIDIVQAVGRVMRKLEGKKYGYVILPVAVPPNVTAEKALDDNERYGVVWQVLNALRAHDDRFEARINQLNLDKDSEVVCVVPVPEPLDIGVDTPEAEQLAFRFNEMEALLRAQVVDRCGERGYWERWAKDVGEIARKHVIRIQGVIDSGADKRKIFDDFLEEVQDDLNGAVTEEEAIEMLAQHLVTKPIFDALFKNYDFASSNPVSQGMQKVIEMLESHNVQKEAKDLEDFYDSVRRRADQVKSVEDRQRTIIELYDRFFQTAFPGVADRFGVVYTPVEVVDFIIHSVNDILKQEFNETLGSKGVHIIDPFTGTGTFITRLLQSKLIKPEELEHKFKNEIHANEIILLAYYIATANIESVYQDLVGGDFVPFEGICLTDTFEMYESEDLVSKLMVNNSDRRIKQKKLDIRVIISNPPYKVGDIGVKYEDLNARIATTYAHKDNTKATNRNSLYDSYIQAIRWASDRVGDNGIVGFVTNGGWLDSKSMDGMRKCLHEEFSSLYVFNLRGNQRTSGDLSKREGGKIFGGGSRAPIAISLLVKNPNAKQHGQIFYHDIGDYLSRDQKLEIISGFGSIKGIEAKSLWTKIQPDKHHDWLNQRDESFDKHLNIGDKTGKSKDILFVNYTNGVQTARDAWCYNSGRTRLESNIQRTMNYFNSQISAYSQAGHGAKIENFYKDNDKEIKWSPNLRGALRRKKTIAMKEGEFRQSIYRPFTKQWLYYGRRLNERVHRTSLIFPNLNVSNRIIVLTGVGERGGFDVMMHGEISDFHSLKTSQQFPLKLYEKEGIDDGGFDLGKSKTNGVAGYKETDGITDYGVKYFQREYKGAKITKEDIFYYVYGLLHSPIYQSRFANNLTKQLPRIPAVKKEADFWAFSKAGRKLGDLHVDYEEAKQYPTAFEGGDLFLADGVPQSPDGTNPKDFYRVEKMKFVGKQRNPNKSQVIYNPNIIITNIPEKAYEYKVNGKSALAWVMERQAVTTDKASGIVNDANDYANETMGDPAYPLKLFQRVITVSLETLKIVENLPTLDID